LYTRHPWLTQFRTMGALPMHYFMYKHEFFIPGTHGLNEPNILHL
jgi:hypothetical protein